MSGARLDGMDDLVALGVACENCGRKRRLARSHIARLIGPGVHTVEQLGQRLKCRPCAERGLSSKNITIVPYYRCDAVAEVRALRDPKGLFPRDDAM